MFSRAFQPRNLQKNLFSHIHLEFPGSCKSSGLGNKDVYKLADQISFFVLNPLLYPHVLENFVCETLWEQNYNYLYIQGNRNHYKTVRGALDKSRCHLSAVPHNIYI